MAHPVRILLISCLAVSTLIALGMPVWNEDLFVAFCSGRDTLNGYLGRPHTWSFTLGYPVLVDQAWLSHLAHYVSYRLVGELGPVLVKSLLFVACMFIIYFSCLGIGGTKGGQVPNFGKQ